MISSLVTVIKLSVATVMDSLNLTHREAMYLLDHVGADKDIITLRLSTTRVGGDKIYFFRGYQGPGRLVRGCSVLMRLRSNDLGPGSDKDDTPGPLPGPYSLVSLRSVPRILYILGIMGAKSNLPAPRTGGAATCVLISPRGVRRSPVCLWPRLLWHRHSKQQSHDPDDQS